METVDEDVFMAISGCMYVYVLSSANIEFVQEITVNRKNVSNVRMCTKMQIIYNYVIKIKLYDTNDEF